MVTKESETLSGKRVLLTGATGQIGGVLARHLAPNNEVWCPARFTAPGAKQSLTDIGAHPVEFDLSAPDFSRLPAQFDYLLHLAAYMGPELDHDKAIQVNAEGTGRLLSRYRNVSAALVMSTSGVYRPNDDPGHRYRESDPLGDAINPRIPTYAISKITEEAVTRFCAIEYGIPTTIGRMHVAYGPSGGLPAWHLAAIESGQTVTLRWDPALYSPIFDDDIAWMVAPLLSAASVPTTIVNWGGDEVVSAQEWCAFFGELTGRTPKLEIHPVDGSQRTPAVDCRARREITGPARTTWRDGMRHTFESRSARATERA